MKARSDLGRLAKSLVISASRAFVRHSDQWALPILTTFLNNRPSTSVDDIVTLAVVAVGPLATTKTPDDNSKQLIQSLHTAHLELSPRTECICNAIIATTRFLLLHTTTCQFSGLPSPVDDPMILAPFSLAAFFDKHIVLYAEPSQHPACSDLCGAITEPVQLKHTFGLVVKEDVPGALPILKALLVDIPINERVIAAVFSIPGTTDEFDIQLARQPFQRSQTGFLLVHVLLGKSPRMTTVISPTLRNTLTYAFFQSFLQQKVSHLRSHTRVTSFIFRRDF